MQKNVIKFIALFVALVCVFYFARKMQQPKIEQAVTTEEVQYETSLPDDFHTFYDQFHTDSVFQMNRIIFPLKGMAKSADSTKIAEEIMWEKSDWILHKPYDNHNGTFERVFTNINGIVSEQITAQGGLFSLEKRYAKLDDEWHLIYYQELLMHG